MGRMLCLVFGLERAAPTPPPTHTRLPVPTQTWMARFIPLVLKLTGRLEVAGQSAPIETWLPWQQHDVGLGQG